MVVAQQMKKSVQGKAAKLSLKTVALLTSLARRYARCNNDVAQKVGTGN